MLTVPASTRTRTSTLIVLGLLALLWPFLGSSDLGVFSVGIGYAIAAVGVDITTGYAGQPNFGQSAFMIIGAYSAVKLEGSFSFGFLPALVVAVLISMVAATILGLAAVRLKNLGFGIITFTFAFAVAALVAGNSLTALTGGPNGLEIPARSLLKIQLSSSKILYPLSLFLLLIVALVAHNFVMSRSGRAMLTVKGDERVAAVLGISSNRVKLQAFALSAAFGAIGGVIIAEPSGFVTPDTFPPVVSITVFGMAALGGLGTLTGPIIGALFFWLVPSYVPGLAEYQAIFVAVIFLLVLVLLPAGAFGSVNIWLVAHGPDRRRFMRWVKARPLARSPASSERDIAVQGDARASAVPIHALSAEEGQTQTAPMLRTHDLRVTFGGVTAVDQVSLIIRSGTCHGLVGPNGAGKTTLLNALSGLVGVTGEIWFGDSRLDTLSSMNRRRLGVARTFQNPALIADLSVTENVKVGLHLQPRWNASLDLGGRLFTRTREKEIEECAELSLDNVGFSKTLRNRKAMELSHGDQKIVDLARALAGDPQLLLLDEPTAGLTQEEMDRFADILTEQNRHRGVTILIVSHHMRFLSGLADVVTVMGSGRVIAEGSFTEVARQEKVVTSFLGEYDATF